MTLRRSHFIRYMAVAAVFCLICVIYLGRLFYIQISGRENSYDTGTTTRRVTIQAVRGELYDRNGNPLVTNSYTYDLTLSYSTLMTSGLRRANETCLHLITALRDTGEESKHIEKYFPFDGAYPYYTLTEEAEDSDSIPFYRMRKVLKAIGLDEDATVDEIVKYYISTYDLLATDANDRRVYDDDEVDRLIHLRYDMDAMSFKSTGEYTFAENAGLPLMTYVKELALAGVTFRVNVERVYNYPGYASHILGTVGPIYSEEWEYYNEQGYQMNAIVGKSGCELAFEQYLHGSDGELEIEEDANGNIVNVTVITEPVAGSDVYLTIDIDLQIAAEDGLAENVAYVVEKSNGNEASGANCNAGAAVVMDPDTFDVLALASYPTYQLSLYNQSYNAIAANEAKPLLNRALSGLYAPGSTFKLGIATAGLMEGVINDTDTINCSGEYPHGSQWSISCSTYGPSSHRGATTVTRAIAQSCNTFFCETGDRLGIDRIEYYMKKFGFGEDTGLELYNQSGILAGPTYRQENNVGDLWYPGNTWQASIGQSDNLASPLQLACYVATIANGGTRYAAHLLHSVYEFGNPEPIFVYEQNNKTILDSIEGGIPDDVQATVFAGMREVVTSNASINALMDSLPVEAGGKTGTAQTGGECDNALYVGSAPYNAPEIVISVVLEKGYAGSRAARTAAAILGEYYDAD